jgi:hypothetical protein
MWTPPLGIPAPPIGLTEVPPTLASWSGPVPGFYFIYEVTGTDVANPYGSPMRPRKTIPNVLPAGAAVVVLGTYSHAHTSPNTLVLQGTKEKPVFIVGLTGTVFTAGIELTGSYGFFQNALAYSVVVRDPASFIVVRDVEFTGNHAGGGIVVAKWGTGNVSDIVLLRVKIHDCGDLAVTEDIDNHGIVLGWGQRIWVLDSEFWRNSGDGIQVNAGAQANNLGLNSVYVGRCKSYDNRQSGLWVKWASDVYFSENECWGHWPGVGTLGAQIGFQYGPDRIYVLNNKVHDGNFGIELASYSGPTGGGAVIYGNEIWNIQSKTPVDITNPWAGGAAVFLSGGNYITVANNTIRDCNGGVHVPTGPAYLNLKENTFTGISGASLNLESNRIQFDYSSNHFEVPTKWVLGGVLYNINDAVANKV